MAIRTEQGAIARYKLSNEKEIEIKEKSPNSFPSYNLKWMKIVVSKELFFCYVHSSMKQLSNDH